MALLRAANDTGAPDAAATGVPTDTTNPLMTPDLPGATPNPTPMPSPGQETPLEEEAQPAPAPTPEPTPESTPEPTPEGPQAEETTPSVPQQPTLPGSVASQQALDAVTMPANPALQQQFSQWDLAQVESPLFLNAAIDDFNQRPIMLKDNWSLKPHFSTSSYYDGNVFLKNTGGQSDVITRFAPGLTMRLGNDESIFYLDADYTVGLNYYLEHPKESTADQEGRGQFQWTLPKTVLALNMNVSSDTGQDIDVSDRVRRDVYFIGLTAHYDFGEKTSFDASADYSRSDFAGLISSSQYEGDLYFEYQYSPKTQMGVGGGVGYLLVPGAPGQEFQQLNLRATYRATGKLTLISQEGLELEELGGGGGETITPVFILEAAWDARAGTSLSLTARRSIYASAILNNQNYTATSFDFSVRQRITDYVDVSLAMGYVNTDYTAAAANVDAVREDNYFYVRPAVEWKALSWLSVGIFYEYSEDISQGGVAANFARDRGGVDIAILF
jgi:hypothetical protein